MVRKIFVYVFILSLILGIVGVIKITGNLSGKAIIENQEKYGNAEIIKHDNKEGCWISAGNEVYDITLFLQVYPDKTLVEKCGKNLESLDYFSEDFQRILKEYKIGIVG
ncbi:MAG: cytochrome b5 domain-containing protein [Nanoarchaeota archaeon]|nr:cytochrome b5 domain-containing protein [Nanoarchaeota archaeon]